jgi:2-oxoglutarate dehydrogenase E1 component
MPEAVPKTTGISSASAEQRERIFDQFRRWGYLAARLDPLGFFPSASPAELNDATPWSSEARAIYCGTIGAEFMHIADPQRRAWIADRFENARGAKADQQHILAPQYILERLIRAELFEQTLQARFVGTKRYSLEGLAVVIPLLDQVVETGADSGAEQLVLAGAYCGSAPSRDFYRL